MSVVVLLTFSSVCFSSGGGERLLLRGREQTEGCSVHRSLLRLLVSVSLLTRMSHFIFGNVFKMFPKTVPELCLLNSQVLYFLPKVLISKKLFKCRHFHHRLLDFKSFLSVGLFLVLL